MKNTLSKLKKFIKDNGLAQYFVKKYLDYCFAACAILLGFYLRWGVENVLFFAFLIWIVLNPISSQLLAKIALIFLISTPLLIIIGRDEEAQKLAIYAFYFIALTVTMALIEVRADKTVHSSGLSE